MNPILRLLLLSMVFSSSKGNGKDLELIISETKAMFEGSDRESGFTFGHLNRMQSFRKVTESSRRMQRSNDFVRAVAKEFGLMRGLSLQESLRMVNQFMRQAPSPGPIFSTACLNSQIACNSMSIYRTITGECNNLQNPNWGKSEIPLGRNLPAEYSDGTQTPKGLQEPKNNRNRGKDCSGIRSDLLPGPRRIRAKFSPDTNITDNTITHMVTQWGQFLDHDLSFSPLIDVTGCCDNPAQEGCLPIPVPDGDIMREEAAIECIENRRSLGWCEGELAVREQVNLITAFIDASQVYGSTEEEASKLRSFVDGKLLSDTIDGVNELLPEIDNNRVAGDRRALEQPGLASVHTIFLREHNRLASLIQNQDSSLSDEDIYQIARRILGAEMQNIVYSEYLPVVLGNDAMVQYDLLTKPGFSTYDPTKNPGIVNSFSTAAYRFGHAMIEGLMHMIHETTNEFQEQFRIRNNFNNLDKYFAYHGTGAEKLLVGLLNQPSQAFNRFTTQEVTNFLLKGPLDRFGSDLFALNIQRGRDHGLPGYNKWREFCGLKPACKWSKKPAEISRNNWKKLKKLYNHPNDIDLFVAGIGETPANGALAGPTFTCIMAKQFKALKFGDRFFYTHDGQTGSFTQAQLDELKKRTFAEIICDNTNLSQVKSNAFLLNSDTKSCDVLGTIDVSLFL